VHKIERAASQVGTSRLPSFPFKREVVGYDKAMAIARCPCRGCQLVTSRRYGSGKCIDERLVCKAQSYIIRVFPRSDA